MEVLQKGRIVDEWIGKCEDCGAIIKAKTDELTKITAGDRTTDFDDFSWETCTFCGEEGKVCFHKKNTKTSKSILRKAGLSVLKS